MGLSRDFTVTLAIRRIIDINKVMLRTVQPKPIRQIKLVIIIGYTMPPRLDPLLIIPNARALFVSNHVPTLVTPIGR
jgi:hypothetical protein